MRKWLLAALLLAGSASAQNVETVPPLCTVAQLAADSCAPAKLGTRVRISNGNAATGDANCAVGTGPNSVLCEFDGSNWTSIDLLYGATSVVSDSELTVVEATADLAGVVGTLEGVDIVAAITACGTDRCRVNLQVGTYTSVCVKIENLDQGIRIIGKGDATILKPYADADSCTATSSGEMLQLNGSDNIELAYFTMDGDKENANDETCNESSSCGNALVVRGPNGAASVSRDVFIHDLTIQDFTGSGIRSEKGERLRIERTSISEVGCHQTDSPCGCGDDPGPCGGWTAAADLSGVVGLKTTAFGIVLGDVSNNGVVRNNQVSGATKAGIEVAAASGATDCGKEYPYCSSGNLIEKNDVTLAASGIILNVSQNTIIRGNHVSLSGQTGILGDVGAGILVTSASNNGFTIEDNEVYDNNTYGMNIKPVGADPTGDVRIRNNLIENNCQADAHPALFVGTTSGTQPRNVLIENNTILNNPLCTYAMHVSGDATHGFLGDVRILGGHYTAGATSTVLLETLNMFVSGLDVTGTLTYGALSSGVALQNDASVATTYTAGSQMILMDAGAIDLGPAGVRLSNDGDGAITLLGLGNGSDEDLKINLDDTANTIALSSSTFASIISLGAINTLNTNADFAFHIDSDQATVPGNNSFQIVNGTPVTVVVVNESGDLQMDGDISVDGSDIDLGINGVRISDDNDGAITFIGRSAGFDEDFTLNLDDTSNTVSVSSSTGVEHVDFGTIAVTLPKFTAFPGTPVQGDLLIITDDSVAGACDSAAGAAVSLCFWNGAAWVNGAGL